MNARKAPLYLLLIISMKGVFSILLVHFSTLLIAQDNLAQNCFNTVDVQLPLAPRAAGLAPAEVAYLVEDEFTFWYRLSVSARTKVNYYVAPINAKDIYESLSYSYHGPDLCQKLLRDAPRLYGQRKVVDEFDVVELDLEKDSTYYLAVLSMSPQDCGHQLILWTSTDTLRIKATHRQCNEDGPELLPSGDEFELDTISPDEHGIDTMGLNEPSLANIAEMAGLSFAAAGKDSTANRDLQVGDKATLQNIHFYPNTYAFKETAREDLEKLLDFLEKAPSVSVEIQGHTASNARVKYVDERYNGLGKEYTFTGTAMELSERRAEAVKGYLEYRKINGARVSTKGLGGEDKLHDVKVGDKDYSKNMRVEIVITAIEQAEQ